MTTSSTGDKCVGAGRFPTGTGKDVAKSLKWPAGAVSLLICELGSAAVKKCGSIRDQFVKLVANHCW